MKALMRLPFIHRFNLQGVASYLVAFFIFAAILLHRSPTLLRPLSMNVRFGFNWVIPFLFVILYFSFRLRGWLGKSLSLTAVLSLFAFALAGVWASGHTQSTYISGLIPLYDAQNYYVDALRLLAGRSMLEFSAARPLFVGFLGTVLAITGRDLMITLMVLTATTGLACFFAAKAIQSTHGPFAAAFLVLFLFLYYRYRTVGTVMSENIGFALGIVAVTLLWWSIRNKSFSLGLYGLFVMTMAINARPGAFFILPALLLWGGWYFRNDEQRFSWRFFLLGIAVMGAGFATNLFIKQSFGVSSGVPFSQFSYALYGLASGGNSWSYIFQVHPELRDMAHPQLTWTAYRLTLDLIRQHPTLIIQGALYNWSALFSDSWYNLFAYAGGENSSVRLLARWSLYVLCLFGLVRWLRYPRNPYNSFILAGTAGLLASVPFVPPTDAYGMRLYAASIIMLGLLPMVGLLFVVEMLKFSIQPIDDTTSQAVVWYGFLLICVILIGPFLVRGIHTIPPLTTTSCEPGMNSMVTVFDDGRSISLLREKDIALDWVPLLHYGLFKRNVHSLPDVSFINRMERVDPRTTLFYTLDYKSNKPALVIMPTASVPPIGSTVEMCGEWDNDPDLESYFIFTARSVTVVPELK